MEGKKQYLLENIQRNDIAICPECGVLFVKKITGQSFGIIKGRAYYCPQCDSFVSKD